MRPQWQYWLITGLSLLDLFLFLQAHPIALRKAGTAMEKGLSAIRRLVGNKDQEKDLEDVFVQAYGSKRVEISLGPGQPPLTLSTYDTGGNHCCENGEVFDAGTGKQVFSSDEYGLDGRISVEDLDGDGVDEIVQNLVSFHYYNGLCYADSPRIDAIFAYDRKSRRFVPAYDRFPALWQDTLKEARRKHPVRPVIPDLDSAKDYETFAQIRKMESKAIEKAVALIFAGYEREAYVWLKRQFVSQEGKRVCNTLRKHLAAEIYYQRIKEQKQKKKAKKQPQTRGNPDHIYAAQY